MRICVGTRACAARNRQGRAGEDTGGRTHRPAAEQRLARARMRHGHTRLIEEPRGPRQPQPRGRPGGSAVAEEAQVHEAHVFCGGQAFEQGGAVLVLERPAEGEELVRFALGEEEERAAGELQCCVLPCVFRI